MFLGDVFSGRNASAMIVKTGLKPAVGYVKRAVNYEQVLVVVHATPLVRDGCLRIVAHAAGAGLMLATA